MNTTTGREAMEITDIQKNNLFQQAMDLLEDKFMMLIRNSKVNGPGMRYSLEQNIGMLIEEISSNNPETAVTDCQAIFEELNRIFGEQDLSKLDYKASDKIQGQFRHTMKIRLSPLIVKKLESIKDTELAKLNTEWFAKAQKQFMQFGLGSFMAIPNKIIPSWYKDLSTRRQYEQLQRDAASDPQAAKILDDVRTQTMRKLRGED